MTDQATTAPADGPSISIKRPDRPVRLSVKARAKVRAAREEATRQPARENPKRLVRTRKRAEDRLYIDPKIIPHDMTYEWKAESVNGKPDPLHINDLMDNHWTPVPESRHPGVVVRRDGLILMERPAYLTDEANEENYNLAMGREMSIRREVRDTPEGHFTRDHPSAKRLPGVKVSYGTPVEE